MSRRRKYDRRRCSSPTCPYYAAPAVSGRQFCEDYIKRLETRAADYREGRKS